jgi:hypothetical protein
MNNLAEFPVICLKWKTSRFLCPWNPYTHDYLGTYMEVLKDRPVKKIVEIGLGPKGLFHPEQVAGCGLFMWQETFPEAQIFGLDIREDTLVNEGNIRSMQCDQSNEAALRRAADWIGPEIDFIVDDASHRWQDQALSVKILAPLLSRTGVYVIEDVLPGEEIHNALPYPHRTVELRTNVLPDDRLIIIEGKDVHATA